MIKMKVTRKPMLKGKMDVRFPAKIIGEGGITAEVQNGNVIISPTLGVIGDVTGPGTMASVSGQLAAFTDGNHIEGSGVTKGDFLDVAGIAALAAGLVVKTATGSPDTYAARTVIGTANEITITNGDGVSGNPTASLPAALTFTGKTVTNGTFNSPALVTPALGTPASGTLTNCTGLPIGSGVSNLGTGVAAFLATPSSSNLAAAVTGETGSGALVFGTSPAITTPTGIVKGDVGLGNVDNTSDATKTSTLVGATHTWASTQTFTVAPVFTAQSGTRTALGLGTAATQNTGTSGANVPLLNGVNTHSGATTFSDSTASSSTTTGAVIVTGGVGVGGAINAGGNITTTSATPSLASVGTTSANLQATAGTNSIAFQAFPAAGNFFDSNTAAGQSFFIRTGVSSGPIIIQPGLATQVSIATTGTTFSGFIATPAPVTKTGTSSTIAASDASIIFNASGTHTATLPAAATYPGRWLYVKSIAAQAINSASSNIVPRTTATAGTVLLASGAGNWASLQSDGTNWVVMAGT